MGHNVTACDAALRDQVMAEMRYTPGLEAGQIVVTAQNGRVELSGRVATYPERLMVEQVARGVDGVCEVSNDVSAHLACSPHRDAALAAEANEALNRAIDIPAGPTHAVRASVANGFLTLTGNTPWQFQRQAAQRCVTYLKGVTGISNDIRIRPQAAPVNVRRTIEDALMRCSELRDEWIVVAEDGGYVVLSGRLRCWSHIQRASTIAWSAPGVISVTSHLRIDLREPGHLEMPFAGRST